MSRGVGSRTRRDERRAFAALAGFGRLEASPPAEKAVTVTATKPETLPPIELTTFEAQILNLCLAAGCVIVAKRKDTPEQSREVLWAVDRIRNKLLYSTLEHLQDGKA